MATIASDVAWGTGPVLYFNFTYSKQRSGTTQQYKIGVECETIASSTGYFGYPIYFDISLDGTVVVDGYTLKEASPSTWSSPLTYTSGWLGVKNKVAGITALKIRVYSGLGSTRNTTYSYTLPVDLVPSTITATNAYIETASTIKITALSSTFTHTLAYMIDGQTSYTNIVSKTSSTSYSWKVPSAAYSKITSGNAVGITIRCQTYSGSALVGTTTTTMTATAAASTVAATDANIESASTITINRKLSTFTHTLAYKMAGESAYTTIVGKTASTSYGWTVPSSAYALIPNAKTIKITIRCQTYSGSTLVGTTTTTMTATAASSKCAPTITIDASDTNESMIALTGNNKAIVKGVSTLSVTATAEAKNSAIVSTISIVNGDATQTFPSPPFTAEYAGTETASASATVTDSRGYSTTAKTSDLTLIHYITLGVNPIIARESPTSDVIIISVTGNYFNGSFGAVDNALTLRYRFREKGTSTWSSLVVMTPTISGNTYTASVSVSGFNYQKAYEINVQASDAIYGVSKSVKSSTKTLAKGIPVFDWGENDFRVNVFFNAMAGGNLLHNENILDNWYFPDPINQRGQTTYTHYEYWIDRWYPYGPDSCATMTIGDEGITLTSNGAYTSGLIQFIENERLIPGATYTLSALAKITDATITSGNPPFLISWGNNGQNIVASTYLSPDLNIWQLAKLTFTAATSGDFYNFRIRCQAYPGSITIKALKLERGEVSTLAYPTSDGWALLDNRPNKAAELAKCQRYYVKFPEEFVTSGFVTSSALSYYMPITLPVTMRTTPTIGSGASWIGRLSSGGYSAHSGSTKKAFTDARIGKFSGNIVTIYDRITTAVDTNNTLLSYFIFDLDLSAELYQEGT